MKNNLPFSLVKRNSIYYRRLKDDDGNIVAWKSTKQKDYNSALKVGFEIFANSKQAVQEASNRTKIRQSELSDVSRFINNYKQLLEEDYSNLQILKKITEIMSDENLSHTRKNCKYIEKVLCFDCSDASFKLCKKHNKKTLSFRTKYF